MSASTYRAFGHEVKYLEARLDHVSNSVSRPSHIYFNLLVPLLIAPIVAVILPSLSSYPRWPPTLAVLLPSLASYHLCPSTVAVLLRLLASIAVLLPSLSSYCLCPPTVSVLLLFLSSYCRCPPTITDLSSSGYTLAA